MLLKAQMQEEIIKKAIVPDLKRRVWAQELQAQHGISIAASCQVVCMSRTTYYHKPKLSDDSEIIDALNKLTDKYNRWGFPKFFKRLALHGVTSTYTVFIPRLNLNLRRKSKRRLPTHNPQPLNMPSALGHTWSMDFMSDRLHNNIRYRTFNVIDDYNRETLGIDIGTSMPPQRVVRYLDQLADGYLKKMRVDNGSEFTSHVFTE